MVAAAAAHRGGAGVKTLKRHFKQHAEIIYHYCVR